MPSAKRTCLTFGAPGIPDLEADSTVSDMDQGL